MTDRDDPYRDKPDPYNPDGDDALAARLETVRRNLRAARAPFTSWIARQHAVERRLETYVGRSYVPPVDEEPADA